MSTREEVELRFHDVVLASDLKEQVYQWQDVDRIKCVAPPRRCLQGSLQCVEEEIGNSSVEYIALP